MTPGPVTVTPSQRITSVPTTESGPGVKMWNGALSVHAFTMSAPRWSEVGDIGEFVRRDGSKCTERSNALNGRSGALTTKSTVNVPPEATAPVSVAPPTVNARAGVTPSVAEQRPAARQAASRGIGRWGRAEKRSMRESNRGGMGRPCCGSGEARTRARGTGGTPSFPQPAGDYESAALEDARLRRCEVGSSPQRGLKATIPLVARPRTLHSDVFKRSPAP